MMTAVVVSVLYHGVIVEITEFVVVSVTAFHGVGCLAGLDWVPGV